MSAPDQPIRTMTLSARQCERLSVLLDREQKVAVNVYADGSIILAFTDPTFDVQLKPSPNIDPTSIGPAELSI